MKAVGSALGKVILLGEHAVVYGLPALGAALPMGLLVEATRRGAGGIALDGPLADDARALSAARAVAARAGVAHVLLKVVSDLPLAAGLGSSAAVSVATARALSALCGGPCDEETIDSLAFEAERVFHGTPSGVDQAVCARGGIQLFRRGPPKRVEQILPARPLPLVLALTGRPRSTSAKVAALALRVQAEPLRYRPLLERMGALAVVGAEVVASGDLNALGGCFDEAHALLTEVGVSSPELDAIVRAGREAGALGAKLTGAGGGGAALVLCEEPGPAAAAISRLGFETRVVMVG